MLTKFNVHLSAFKKQKQVKRSNLYIHYIFIKYQKGDNSKKETFSITES